MWAYPSIPQVAEESEKEPSKGKGLLKPLILDQGQCARERQVWCSPVHRGDYHSYYPGIQSCGACLHPPGHLGCKKEQGKHAPDGEWKAAEWSRTRGHEQPAVPPVDPEMGSDGGWQVGPKETSSQAELSHHLGIFLILRRKVRNSLL